MRAKEETQGRANATRARDRMKKTRGRPLSGPKCASYKPRCISTPTSVEPGSRHVVQFRSIPATATSASLVHCSVTGPQQGARLSFSPFHIFPLHYVVGFRYVLPTIPLQIPLRHSPELHVVFLWCVNSLWSPRPSHAEPIHSFLRRSLPQNFHEFVCSSRRNFACSAVTVPIRKDRDVEKTCSRALSSIKGTTPGAVLNEEEVINSDASFLLLNLGPLDGEPASRTNSERGLYLHLSSLIIFLPHHILVPLSRSARPDPTQFGRLLTVCSCVPPSHVAGVPSWSLVLSPQTPNLGFPC